MKVLTKIFAPFLLLGSSIAGLFAAVKLGWLSEETAFWLIPVSLTVVFIAIAVFVGIKIGRVWLWPTGALAVVQLVATLVLLLSSGILETLWDPLKYSLAVTAAVLAIMLIAWAISTVRARMLERKMAEGSGTGADLERIRKDMRDALDLLRRAGQGRNAVYQLPWFLVMGRPAAGKTVAIKNSELGLPVKRDWVKGVGGTYTADWFFTNELIFLDTPGGWVTDGATEDGQETWRELMRLLRKYRGRQPLDGLIVVVPADDLLGLNDDQLEDQATNVREVVDLIHEQLDFRFPIYVLVTKCDLVEGFVDFFRGLPPKRRHEILGWSNPDPNEPDAESIVEKGFGTVQRRLQDYRLEMLGKVASRTQSRRLFFFTEEFRGLERPLSVFTQALFGGDRYSEPPVFRGFYFSSGTQEGAPLGKALEGMRKAFGLPAPHTEAVADEGSKRSYFLLQLFRELMVGDDGLVGRSAAHWWRRRRNTALGVFAPAAIAVGLLLLSGLALALNKATYRRVLEQVGPITATLQEIRGSRGLPKGGIEEALDETERLRGFHKQMTGLSPFRTFGMRRPDALATKTAELFADELSRTVLRPTLAEASHITETDKSCVDRIQVLRSVVWLRTGRRAGYEDLAGLDKTWGLGAASRIQEDKAIQIRKKLRMQFVHLKNLVDAGEVSEDLLLPEFSVMRAAEAIFDECGKQGSTSAAESFRRWQADCRSLDTDTKSVRCYSELADVMYAADVDYQGFLNTFDELKRDLDKLAAEIPGGELALDLLNKIDVTQRATNECLTTFDTTVVPPMKAFVVKDDLLVECQQRVKSGSSRAERTAIRQDVLKGQLGGLEEEADNLARTIANFELSCSKNLDGLTVDLDVINNVALTFRRVACFEEDLLRLKHGVIAINAPPTPAPIETAQRTTPRANAGGSKPSSRPAAAPPRPSGTAFFESPKGISNSYKSTGVAGALEEWGVELAAFEEGYTESQKITAVGQLKGDVAGYGARFAGAWKERLESIQLKPQPPAEQVPSWLRKLAESPEFVEYIEDARSAVNAVLGQTEPPFDTLAGRVGSLKKLADLEVSEYLGMLPVIADEIEACQADSSKWTAYRAKVEARDDSVTLIKARKWIAQRAGPDVAGGALTRLFETPINAAESILGDMLQRSWEDLVALHRKTLAPAAPFSRDLEDPPIGFGALVAALGQGTGALGRVLGATEGKTLAPDAQDWLRVAQQVSSLFFEPGTDTPHALRLAFEVGEPEYAQKGLDKAYSFRGLHVELGNGVRDWEQGTNARLSLGEVALCGPGASDYAFVESVLSTKEKRFGGLLGKKWDEDGEGFMANKFEGPLAPLKLLASALQPEDGDLVFVVDLDWKKKKEKEGTINIPVRLTGEDAAALLELMRNGLPAPPEQIMKP